MSFDEFGGLKFHIGTGVRSERQSDHLQSLWDRGYFHEEMEAGTRIAQMHRNRLLGSVTPPAEDW